MLASDPSHLEAEAAPLEPAPTTTDLFRAYASHAWRALRRLGVSASDVEDVCQEVFITVHRRLPTFEGRSSLLTWIYGICVKVAADHRKRLRTRRERMAEFAAEPIASSQLADPIAIREARAKLDRILDGLEDSKRAVFVLYEIEELPMGEVATALGVPIQTAYSRLHAARAEVAAAIGRAANEESSP